MEYLIDGYNVLAVNKLSMDESGRMRLRARLLSHFAGKQVQVRVVYDHRGHPFPRVETISSVLTEVFVSHADPYIVERAESFRNPRALTVVTDDRKDIVNRVRPLRVHLQSSREFFELISPREPAPDETEPKPESDSAEEIARLRELFDH
jgi:predicted RNA-binding protein with PIN domain